MKETTPKPRVRAQETRKPAPQDLQRWIAEAAYYRSESRGFQPGGETQDWLAAEAEILERLRAGRGPA